MERSDQRGSADQQDSRKRDLQSDQRDARVGAALAGSAAAHQAG